MELMKSLADFQRVYELPLPELIFRAAQMHREHHDATDIQRCALLSIKTGGCAEDCGYCAQSAHFKTGVTASKQRGSDHHVSREFGGPMSTCRSGETSVTPRIARAFPTVLASDFPVMTPICSRV